MNIVGYLFPYGINTAFFTAKLVFAMQHFYYALWMLGFSLLVAKLIVWWKMAALLPLLVMITLASVLLMILYETLLVPLLVPILLLWSGLAIVMLGWYALLLWPLAFFRAFSEPVKSVLKPRMAHWMFKHIPLRGDELIVDAGCSEGLMVIDAARRVPRGKVVGIDLWKVLSFNHINPAEAVQTMLTKNGVAAWTEVIRTNIRSLPFKKDSVDLVFAAWTLHEIKRPGLRRKALRELWRVCKPGGTVAVLDYTLCDEYEEWFKEHGCRIEKYEPVKLPFLRRHYLLTIKK